jgi:hypothetical protein
MLTKSKYVILAALLVWSCSFVYTQALTYSQIAPSQGTVLGDSTSTFYPYPTGTLVNDSGTVYFIAGTTKVPFTSWPAFIGLGYSSKNIVAGDLTNYTPSTSYTIHTANAAHPWGSWLIYKGTVYYSTQDGLIGVPSAQVFTSNGGDWQYIVRTNSYDVAILNSNPSLPLLSVGDSRVMTTPAYQFGNTLTTNPTTGTTTTPNNSIPNNSTYTLTQPTITGPTSVVAGQSNLYTALAQGLDFNSNPGYYITYTYDWGDGSAKESNAVQVGYSDYHVWQTNGIYTVTVTVQDSNGQTSSNTLAVKVSVASNNSNTTVVQQNNNTSLSGSATGPTPTTQTSNLIQLPSTNFPNATAGQAYTQDLTINYTGNAYPSASYSGNLPPGFQKLTILKIDFITQLVLTGLPSTAGTYSIPLTFTDEKGAILNENLTITVNPTAQTSSNSAPTGTTNSYGTVTVSSPNGGEVLNVGQTYTITWTSSGNFTSCEIILYNSAGIDEVIAGSVPNTGSYNWTVSASGDSLNLAVPNQFKITVIPRTSTGGTVADSSDAYFTINGITNAVPSGNQSSSSGTSGSTSSSSSNTASTTCTPTASSASPQGTSNSIGTVTVTSPNGGECWQRGSAQNITWTNTSGIDSVAIMLQNINSTAYWIAGTPIPNTNSFSWTVPTSQTPGQYKIIITGYKTGVGNLQDGSDGFFTIY